MLRRAHCQPTAEAMLEHVYDLVVPTCTTACVRAATASWLASTFAGGSARRSMWELFAPLPPRAVAQRTTESYFDSLKKTVGFVQQEVVQWRESCELEHETAIPRIDGEPEARGAPHELVVLIAMGLRGRVREMVAGGA